MQSTTSGHAGLHPGETLLIRVMNTGWYHSEINQTEKIWDLKDVVWQLSPLFFNILLCGGVISAETSGWLFMWTPIRNMSPAKENLEFQTIFSLFLRCPAFRFRLFKMQCLLFSLPGRSLWESASGFSDEKLQHTKQVLFTKLAWHWGYIKPCCIFRPVLNESMPIDITFGINLQQIVDLVIHFILTL